MRPRALLAAVLVAIALPACGDGSGPVTSGVDPTRPLGSLSPAEADRVCRAAAANTVAQQSTRQFQEGACRWNALLLGGMQSSTAAEQVAQCESFYNLCMSGSATAGSGEPTCDFGPCTEATVGDYEACMIGTTDAWMDAFAAVPPCSALASGLDVFEALPTPVPPPSCNAVLACAATTAP